MSEFELYEIIDRYQPENEDLDQSSNQFQSTFQPLNSIEKFTIFVEYFLRMKTDSLKRDKLFQLLTINLDQLKHLLIELSISNDIENTEIFNAKFINILVSFPELISNLYGRSTQELFHYNNFVSRLCLVIEESLEQLSCNNEISLIPLHQIVNRLLVKGYSDIVWNCLVKKLSLLVRNELDSKFPDNKRSWISILVDLLFGRPAQVSHQNVLRNSSPSPEPVIKLLFQNISQIRILCRIFSEYFTSNSHHQPTSPEEHKVSIILQHKLLQFSRTWDLDLDYRHKLPDRILINILLFLGPDWFRSNHLSTWSNSSAFKLRSYREHFHLCRTILIGAKIMFEFRQDKLKYREAIPEFRRATIAGAELHFYSSQMEYRAIGLQATVLLLDILGKFSKIELELPKFDEIDESHQNEDCQYLKRLSKLTIEDIEKLEDEEEQEEEMLVEESFEIKNNLKEDQSSKVVENVRKSCNKEEEENLDSDDDLVPYDMSNDISLQNDIGFEGKEIETNQQRANIASIQQALLIDNSGHAPVYLQDCIDGLVDYEKPQWMERCLNTCEQIVRANFPRPTPHDQPIPTNFNPLDSYALKLTKILFHLDNKLSIQNFSKLRNRSLVACCVGSPKIVATFLGSQFYAPFLSIRNRLDVLAILTEASEELSRLKPTISTQQQQQQQQIPTISSKTNSNSLSKFNRKYFSINLNESGADDEDSEEGDDDDENHKKLIVDKRIKENTRYFTSTTIIEDGADVSRHSSTTFRNRFVPVVEHFFYPLLRDPARVADFKLNLFQEDAFVLEQLILTFGLFVQNCAHHSEVMRMSKELLDWMAMYRNHEQSNVRLSIIVTLYTLLGSTPISYLFGDQLLPIIIEYQLWLKEIIQTNLDKRCTDRACATLVIISELSKQNRQQQQEQEEKDVGTDSGTSFMKKRHKIGDDSDREVQSKSSLNLDSIIQQIKRVN